MRWMVWFICVVGLACLFTGCATDSFYNAGKTIYIAGKKVVVENWDNLPLETRAKLIELDRAATTYDSARKVLKPAVEEAIKDVKSDLEKNKTSLSKSSVGGRE